MSRVHLLALSAAIAALAAGQSEAAPNPGVRTILTVDDILDAERAACAAPAVKGLDASTQEAAAPPQALEAQDTAAAPRDELPLEGRRRPGRIETFPERIDQTNPGAVRAPPPEAFPHDELPVPDRWRLAGALGVTKPRWMMRAAI